MKLPVIDSYAFPVILPSTKEPINVRPFLVKEEKILLLSQESNNPDMQVDAIAQVIKNCTFNAIDPRHAPYFDVEYLLLQIRSRSVGEVINPTYKCHTIIPELNTECGHLTNISINLSEIPPTNVDKTPKDFLVNISNRFELKLKYPTIYTVNDLLLAATNSEFPTAEKTLNAIVDMFDTLTDKSTGATYNFEDYSMDEKTEFMDRMTPQDYKGIIKFLENIPSISHTTTYTCANCNTTHAIRLEGLTDFLV